MMCLAIAMAAAGFRGLYVLPSITPITKPAHTTSTDKLELGRISCTPSDSLVLRERHLHFLPQTALPPLRTRRRCDTSNSFGTPSTSR